MEPERVYAELEKARARIGHTADEAMRWLLRFAALDDLNQLSAGDWLNTQFEVLALGKFSVPGVTPTHPFMRLHYALAAESVIHPDELRAVHATARTAVQKVLDREIIDWSAVPLTAFQRGDPLRFLLLPEPTWTLTTEGEFAAAVTYTLIHLFAQKASRIRRCPQCQKVHLTDRENKFYCSTKCQNAAGTLRYRQAHGLISGRKRGRPRKEESDHGKPGRTKQQRRAKGNRPERKTRPNPRRR